MSKVLNLNIIITKNDFSNPNQDLTNWAFRKNDADEWNFNRNINMKCHHFSLPMEFYKGTPGEVPEKFRNRQFRRSADDNSRLNYGEKFYARAIMNDKLEHLIFSGQVRPEARVKTKLRKKSHKSKTSS